MTAIPTTRLVTIFGGSGFLGRHIVRALANDGWRIRVAVRKPHSAYFLRPMGRVGQIQVVKANALNEAAVNDAVKGADAVINLVGILAQSGGQRFDALHVEAAGRIAQAAARHLVERLVHVSALGASTEVPSHYYRSKAAGETRLRERYPAATIVRPSLLFGPEDSFFNTFGALARTLPALPLIGGGKTRVQPVFAGDVAQAVARILRDPATAGKTYELGGPEVMTFKDIMELVLRTTHRKRGLVPVPFGLARILGAVLGYLPGRILTVDQVRMLESDNVVGPHAQTFRDLGMVPDGCEAIIESYLWRFRKEGEFEAVAG